MPHYSTIIKNGLVFDGNGNKPFKADIGITDDEIKNIGDLQKEAAYNIVDATGRCVAPGFIDITNHSDTHWTIFSFPRQESLVSQGITTIIGGNCGSSLAPFLGEASAKEIGRWADTSKIRRMLGWKPRVSFDEGVKIMLENIGYWKDAPLWTPEKIQEATKDWFRYLSG